MSNDLNMQLPLDGFGDDRPWALPEQEPTTLIALWPDDQPPMVTEITAAIAGVLAEEMNVMGEIDPEEEDGDVQWIVIVELPGMPHPVMLWTEPADPAPPEGVDPAEAARCRWIVGAETLLGTDDPLSCHTFLMQCLAAGLPDVPAILDANTTLWHGREELETIFLNEQVEPPADGLWIIHAVGRESAEREQDQVVWLHTHGLWRCGLPELEMLEVPRSHVDLAATLLNEIASLMFDYPPPPPGEPFEIGAGVSVTLQPWEVFTKTMDAQLPGGMHDRQGEHNGVHTGVRAVVCDTEQRGQFARAWIWPERAIEAMSRDEVTLYRTRRATERQAKLARARWDQFATAYSSAHRALIDDRDEPQAIFLIKAGFQYDGAEHENDREHLWFEVRGFHNGGADAVLVNQPQNIARLQRGDAERIKPEQVSDWQVQTPRGIFGPDDIDAMWQTLDELKQSHTARSG